MAESRHDLRVIENVLVGRPPADDATETTAFFDREAGTLYLPVEDAWVTPGGVVSGPPEAHAASHATAGSDPITPASIGAETPAGAQSKVDTAAAAASTALSTHEADTTSVHGIPDTTALETTTGAQTKADDAQSAAQLYADGVASTAQSAAESTAASALSTHSADTTSVHGITDTAGLALIDGSRAVSAINAADSTAANNTVRITPTANKSASTSAGGALLVTNTGSTGAGVVIYTNLGATSAGRLFVVRSDNTAFTQQAMFLQYKGTNHGFAIDHQGTGSASLALSVVSTNTDDTTGGFTGSQTGRGTLKVTHNKPSGLGDSNAAAVSIYVSGTGTAAKGIFMDAPDGGTTGNLLDLRSAGSQKLVLESNGTLWVNGTQYIETSHFLRERLSTNQSITSGAFIEMVSDSDTDGSATMSTSGNGVLVSATGVYRISWSGAFAGASLGARILTLLVDSTAVASQRTMSVGASYSTDLSVTRTLTITSGSVVKLLLYQDSGGTVNTSGPLSLSVERIG